ncbi:MAG: hypothetical protein CMN00_04315 [Rickettsiales bacterium]|nr:hypothetical protein [Rickettsiales bacterium]
MEKKIFLKKKIKDLHLNKKTNNAGTKLKKFGLNLIKKKTRISISINKIYFKIFLKDKKGRLTNLSIKKIMNENIKIPKIMLIIIIIYYQLNVMRKYRLLYFVSEDHYFLTHKLPHALLALKNGYEVMILCKISKYKEKILSYGFKIKNIDLDRRSLNPIKELKSIIQVNKVFRDYQPHIVQNIALKPVIYGSINSIFTSKIIKQVNSITGLGYLFINKGLKIYFIKFIILLLMKFLFKKKHTKIIFQNKEDFNFFQSKKIVSNLNSKIISGSGVDINFFKPSQKKILKKYDLIMHSRMLLDKGIIELIKASEILKKKKFTPKILLLGNPDPKNRASVKKDQLKDWSKSKYIEWIPATENVLKYILQSRIAILPSYREGFPKSLLEAASCGLPLISTDVPGCKEICINNFNGIIVKPKDPKELASAIKKLILDKNLIKKFGANSRKLVIENFSDQVISKKFFDIYKV